MFILKPSFLLFYKVSQKLLPYAQCFAQSLYLFFFKLSFLPDGDQGNWILVNLDNLIDWSLLVVLVYAFSPFDNFWLFKVSSSLYSAGVYRFAVVIHRILTSKASETTQTNSARITVIRNSRIMVWATTCLFWKRFTESNSEFYVTNAVTA